MEYAWFNNVETKPGIGYPKNWEDQEEWQGGWVRDVNGKIRPRLGNKMGVITKIFANPVVPQIDDYYEPFMRFLNFPAHRQTRLGQHPARELCRLDRNCYGTSGNVLVNQPYPSFP